MRISMLGLALVMLGCAQAVPVDAADEKKEEKEEAAIGLGDGPGRNFVNLKAKGLNLDFIIKPKKKGDPEKGILWKQPLGNLAYGGPVIAGGRIFVGTNNERPRDGKLDGDHGIVMCFEEKSGKFL